MKHSFKLKKTHIKSIFLNKFEIKTVAIDNSEDAENAINTFLAYNELEDFLKLTQCSHNFLDGTVTFQLELNPSKEKSDFFESIRKFESFVEA